MFCDILQFKSDFKLFFIPLFLIACFDWPHVLIRQESIEFIRISLLVFGLFCVGCKKILELNSFKSKIIISKKRWEWWIDIIFEWVEESSLTMVITISDPIPTAKNI